MFPQPASLPRQTVGGEVGVVNDMNLLHYAQEQQRKKEEGLLARKKMFELEDTIREIQERCIMLYTFITLVMYI